MAKEKDNSDVTADADDESGSKLLTIIIVLIIVIIWLAIFAVLIRLDVGGFGSGVMYPVLKDVPVVNKILPEPDTREETVEYDDLDEANEKIKELEAKLAAKTGSNDESTSEIDELRKENNRLKKYEQDQKAFANRVYDFDYSVVYNDKAPATAEYYTYFNDTYPEIAEKIYNKVAKKFIYSQKVIDQSETLAKMTPTQAASALTTMSGDLTLVAKLLDCMQASKAAAILNQMDAGVVAQITTKMTNMKKK